jgi:hypothetical protein
MAWGNAAKPAREVAETGYFQSSWPIILILGSFFVLTVPLCLLAAGDQGYLFRWSFGLIYLGALGMTHFVVTLALYLQGANLRHFWSSSANRITYFGLPLAIFLFFDLYHALGVAVVYPLFDLVLRYAVRLMDFQHFGRQAYGVSHLFRMRSGCPFPEWMRGAENHHFTALTLLMFVTYLTGGVFRPNRPVSFVLLGIAVCLFLWVLVGFAIAWRRGGLVLSILPPLGYFLLQTASAGLAVYSTGLYAFALAMHYVEYHVLMAPRCFHTRLDPTSRVDRVFGRLRRHRVLFYGLLLALAVPITRFAWLGMGALLRAGEGSRPVGYRMLISVFDGLFVFHYLIESRIWRFGDPFYRSSLLPLYFREAAPPRPVADGLVATAPALASQGEPVPETAPA